MKTAELTGAALDWAVAKCEGAGAALVTTHSRGEVLLLSDHTTGCDAGDHYSPSTNWAQGGPIIEREGITTEWTGENWMGYIWHDEEFFGPTPLVVAMRSYVALILGDEVEIPQELLREAA